MAAEKKISPDVYKRQGFLLGASLMRSFAQTVHYTVWHTADQIGSRGGWLEHFECRVRTSAVSYTHRDVYKRQVQFRSNST